MSLLGSMRFGPSPVKLMENLHQLRRRFERWSPRPYMRRWPSRLHATASVSAAARYIESISGGIRVSANLPALASNIGTALISKTAQAGSVAPVWEGLSLIRDPYYGSGVRPSQL